MCGVCTRVNKMLCAWRDIVLQIGPALLYSALHHLQCLTANVGVFWPAGGSAGLWQGGGRKKPLFFPSMGPGGVGLVVPNVAVGGLVAAGSAGSLLGSGVPTCPWDWTFPLQLLISG